MTQADVLKKIDEVPPFSVIVRDLRLRLGMTQEDFAEKFEIPVANVRNWEQSSRGTKPDTAARLLIAMINVDPERTASIIKKAAGRTLQRTPAAASAA